MKKVKLYTVNTQEVLAYDRVRYWLQRPLSHLAHCEDKVLECAEVVDVPVQRVCKRVDGKLTDYYLAIAPDLLELLNCAAEAKYKSTIAGLNISLADSVDDAWDFKNRIEQFNKLPWYKRLFAKA